LIAIGIGIGIGIGIEIVRLVADGFRRVLSRSDRSDLETVVDTFLAAPEPCRVDCDPGSDFDFDFER